MSRVQSSIGVAQHYGPRGSNDGLPNSVSTYGPFRVMELSFDWEQANGDLPNANGTVDAATLTIPANSIITRAYLQVGTPWTSANDPVLVLGIAESDGGTENANGIDSLQKAVLLAGATIVSDGDGIGVVVGDEDVQLIVTVTEDSTGFTAGTARLVVEYLPSYV